MLPPCREDWPDALLNAKCDLGAPNGVGQQAVQNTVMYAAHWGDLLKQVCELRHVLCVKIKATHWQTDAAGADCSPHIGAASETAASLAVRIAA